MPRISRSPLLTISIDRNSSTSLQVQLFDQIKDAILDSRVSPGSILPATRVLASELGVSRVTVLGAFDRLLAEGYVEGKMGAGTQVSDILPEDLLTARKKFRKQTGNTTPAGKLSGLSRISETMTNQGRHYPKGVRAFRPSLPDLRQFPFQLWSKIIARTWKNPTDDLILSGDMRGYYPLRESIAAYLSSVRGLHCSADQVIITSGAQQALDLIARTIIDPGDDVWVEDPGYSGLQSTLKAAGARVSYIPIDDNGLSVEEGCRQAPKAVLAAVTPSHQFPLGVTMSLTRRLELLDWATKANAWILEDDYDSEFRYGGKPLSALQGLDETGRVIYVGTFSKVLFPSLRLGHVVVPKSLLVPFTAVRASIDDYPALALQPALHSFIDDGHFASHIRKLRALYAERQDMLLGALKKHASGLLSATSHEAGMHLIAHLNPVHSISDRQAACMAQGTGLVALALSEFYRGTTQSEGLILGYAGLTKQEIARDVKRLAMSLTSEP